MNIVALVLYSTYLLNVVRSGGSSVSLVSIFSTIKLLVELRTFSPQVSDKMSIGEHTLNGSSFIPLNTRRSKTVFHRPLEDTRRAHALIYLWNWRNVSGICFRPIWRRFICTKLSCCFVGIYVFLLITTAVLWNVCSCCVLRTAIRNSPQIQHLLFDIVSDIFMMHTWRNHVAPITARGG